MLIKHIIARHYCLPFEDNAILHAMYNQKVMRIEERRPDGETFAFIAINQRLVSKEPFKRATA